MSTMTVSAFITMYGRCKHIDKGQHVYGSYACVSKMKTFGVNLYRRVKSKTRNYREQDIVCVETHDWMTRKEIHSECIEHMWGTHLYVCTLGDV